MNSQQERAVERNQYERMVEVIAELHARSRQAIAEATIPPPASIPPVRSLDRGLPTLFLVADGKSSPHLLSRRRTP